MPPVKASRLFSTSTSALSSSRVRTLLVLSLLGVSCTKAPKLELVDRKSTEVLAKWGVSGSLQALKVGEGQALVVDLTGLAKQTSMQNIFAAFLYAAQDERDETWSVVELRCMGKPKFRIPGPDFQRYARWTVGRTDMGVMTSFPPILEDLDGKKSFPKRPSGLDGLSKSLEDFMSSQMRWYGDDFKMKASQPEPKALAK